MSSSVICEQKHLSHVKSVSINIRILFSFYLWHRTVSRNLCYLPHLSARITTNYQYPVGYWSTGLSRLSFKTQVAMETDHLMFLDWDMSLIENQLVNVIYCRELTWNWTRVVPLGLQENNRVQLLKLSQIQYDKECSPLDLCRKLGWKKCIAISLEEIIHSICLSLFVLTCTCVNVSCVSIFQHVR